jgi:hypothetical protein
VRVWFVAPLLVCACSGGGIHSGSMPETADFLPMIGDSIAAQPSMVSNQDSVAVDSTEQPRLVLRCEQGRVSAYLVAGTPLLLDSAQSDGRVVPVLLDSQPSC